MKKITLLLIAFLGSIAMYAQSSAPPKGEIIILEKSSNKSEISGFEHLYNASTNKLTLSADKVLSSITLYNILGQRVVYKKLSSTKEIINLEVLKAGIYLANVEVNTNYLTTFKIVKR